MTLLKGVGKKEKGNHLNAWKKSVKGPNAARLWKVDGEKGLRGARVRTFFLG